MSFNAGCGFLADCKVDKMLFPMGFGGLWWYTAYVILSSADDVDKAIAKHGHLIGKTPVRGGIFQFFIPV